MIKSKVAEGILHGIKITPSAPSVSHLFFADDSILLARATLEEAAVLHHIITDYEAFSGQKIYVDKSELSTSPNVPSLRITELEQFLGVKAVERHEKYLGLPP